MGPNIRVKSLLALGAGILGTLAFSPFNLWWAGLISLALLMWLTIKHPGFLIGWIYGLGFLDQVFPGYR